MASDGWSLVQVNDVITDAVPDREMIICEDTRRTFAAVRDRSRSLARYLVSRSIGQHRERDRLEGWEIGQDTVAIVLHNCAEYIEAMYGAYRARAVPFNVNQHYRAAEMAALLTDVSPAVVVYHRRYGRLVELACAGRNLLLLHIDDGSDHEPLAGSVAYEAAISEGGSSSISLPSTSPDDVYMVCTGGTTGRPKAVLWRQADAYVGAMAGTDAASAESIAATARRWTAGPWYAVPPLMHAAAQWTAFSGLHMGAPMLVHDDSATFDAARVLRLAERERAFMMSIVGDAYALPMVEELNRGTYDLSTIALLGTGGAATSGHLKDALSKHLPNGVIRDGYGASETGGMAFDAHVSGTRRPTFAPSAGATVVSADRTRLVDPGEDELGWIARRGHVPIGYLHDEDRTRATFPTIDGERLSIPGDRGRLRADGSIVLVGRDSLVINTGGEKVFVEEVEEVLRSHPRIRDALVAGRPSDRFGSEVVALVEFEPGLSLALGEIRDLVGAQLARFKAPRAVAVCDRVRRLANGKGDYAWAAEAALDAHDATGAS